MNHISNCQLRSNRPRGGTSTVEVFVSFLLLTSVLSVALPLVVRHDRLLTTHAHYRLALEELSNQLDRLTGLPLERLPEELEELTLCAFAAEKLRGAELTGELAAAQIGQRLTLRLSWDSPQRQAAPLVMSAWLVATSEQSAEIPEGDDLP